MQENNNVNMNNNSKISNGIKKISLWVGGGILVLLIILFFLGLYGQRFENYLMIKSQEKYLAYIEKQKAEILEMQKNDTYGGTTPEETLDLYIEALKAGDIELASKYWEVSLKEGDLRIKSFSDLSSVIKRDDNLNIVINYIDKIINKGKKNTLSRDLVSFVYEFITEEEIVDISIVSQEEIKTIIPKGTSLDIEKSLRLNPYTKVWKIIQ